MGRDCVQMHTGAGNDSVWPKQASHVTTLCCTQTGADSRRECSRLRLSPVRALDISEHLGHILLDNNTAMRASSALRRAAQQATAAETHAPQRLSKTAEKRTPFLPTGQAPRSTLSSLIGLHHESANFMRDPAEITTAFESAFRHHTPQFQSYSSFRAAALRAREEHATGGLTNFATQSPGGLGARRAIALADEDDLPDQAQVTRNVFRPARKWTNRSRSSGELSERELKVKEALFGTWERAQDGVPRPALDGVVDVLEARGLSVEEAAKQWKNRE